MAGSRAGLALITLPNLSINHQSLPSSSSSFPPLFLLSQSSSTCSLFAASHCSLSASHSRRFQFQYASPSQRNRPSSLSYFRHHQQQLCKAAEYVFPDPIPEFAEAETEKFKTHLLKKLSKKDIYGDSIEEVVGICTEIFSTFLHTEYGGPGTLLVIPFIDMADTLNERGLPGGPQAARAAVVWAQNHVDKDWNEWTGNTDDDAQ
ncbi:protein PLASTID REDOX INSENSITIVE 2, chloroplastic [Magnolia sinica]|uniref:protein PLASTID REDOX INSENSITIVE 2, chloroplastic n=1 Tax=Magnolia sinica TaxID=86752 RepID=UPI002658CB1D|nr:protein PLASTID REDOX INSENSITIVE 2, chloroplastic [Magnolia sinica]